MLEAWGNAAEILVDPVYWAAISIALFLAIVSGVIPGVSGLVIMALLLPFIIVNVDDPVIGLVMLATLTGVNNTLDSIPAILFGYPGAATQVTFLEGHQMARRGEAAYALGAVYAVSAIGGVVGAILLMITIPIIRPFILAFGYGEITAIALFGLALIAMLGTGAVVKGVIGAMFGLLIGTIGIAPSGGTHRYVFGELGLWQGIPLIPAALGIFALPEMVDLLMTRRAVAQRGADISYKETFRGFRVGLSKWKVAIRQSIFGTVIGAVPGTGGSVIDWLSYAFGILFEKDKSQFGKGSLDGVLFAESAQNAKEGGQAIPSLAFGVPGSAAWAIIIVAMLVYGVVPGPQMMDQYAHLTLVMVFTLAFGNLVVTMLGLVATTYLARLTLVPYPAIAAFIIPVSLVAAFIGTLNWIAYPVVFGLAAIGLIMKKYQWPRPPLFIGFILGPIIEKNLWDAVNVHGWTGLLVRPLTVILVILAVVMGIVFHYLMQRSASSIPTPAGGSGDRDAASEQPTRSKIWPPPLRWHSAHIMPLIFIAIATYGLIEGLEFPGRAGAYPTALSSLVIALSVIQLLRQARQASLGSSSVMDLGILSTGTAGATRTGLMALALLVLFSLLATLVGVPWAAVVLAFVTPLPLLNGKWRIIVAGLAGALVYGFIFGFIEWLMSPIWPAPALGRWLFG